MNLAPNAKTKMRPDGLLERVRGELKKKARGFFGLAENSYTLESH